MDVTDDTALAGPSTAVVDELGPRRSSSTPPASRRGPRPRTIPAEDWRRVVDINLTGTFLACQAFARVVLRAGGSASIVNV